MQSENENKESWNPVERFLASEIIASREKVIRATSKGLFCITVISVVTIIGLLILLQLQSNKFVDYLSQYDFVSQDGEGYNYYNSEIKGDVSNGTENQKVKEQEPETRNGD